MARPDVPNLTTRVSARISARSSARGSLLQRRASMHRFERLYGRVLIVATTTGTLAMAAFICLTAHLLG